MRAATATVLALGALVLGSAGPARASVPAPKQRLVLVSEAAGFALPTLVRESGAPLQFGLPVGIHGSAAISPDGTQAALVDTVQLFPGMTPPTLLVGGLLAGQQDLNVGAVTGRATWSPDGTKVAYAGKRNGSSWDIWVVSLTQGAVPIDLTPASPAADLEPRWSPDGTKIAFESDRTGDLDLYTMNADGSAVTDVTGDPAADTLGDWSPDAQQLVFTSNRSGNGDLYLTSRAGGAATRLTSDAGADTRAAWSPDGATIAYSSDADGDNEVFTIAPDGSAGAQLTDNSNEDLVQDWQPLRDFAPPVIHALRSSGVRGHGVSFRFTIRESSGQAAVDLRYSYETRRGTAGVEASAFFDSLRAGHVYRFRLPADAVAGARGGFRFCLLAVDASVNFGKRSCAHFRLLAPKRKPKR